MNSFTGRPDNSQRGGGAASSLKNYEFDFGLDSNFSSRGSSRPLRDQKNPLTAPNPSSSSISRPPSSSSSSSPYSSSWASNNPSWTHQPSPNTAAAGGARSGLSNPTSMVGDIFGKSWASGSPAAGLGVPKSDPNLFGDLLGSAVGQGKVGSGNVPLKAAAPRNSYSMGNLADSLPKVTTPGGNHVKSTSWGSADTMGNLSAGQPMDRNAGNKMGSSSGGQPMKTSGVPMNAKPTGAPTNANKDPFGSLVDFGSKPLASPSPTVNSNSNFTGSSNSSSNGSSDYSFGAFQNANLPKTDNFGAKMDDFGIPPVQEFHSQQQPPPQPKGGVDPLDMLFSSTGSSVPAAVPSAPTGGAGSQPSFQANDWDLGAQFGGSEVGGTTTELEGLPPPPVGVTALMAKNKGLDNHNQGQYADAIKWLSWAVVLLEKSGDSSATTEVLSCRASCYKQVGEYKKAVADCSKVLEDDVTNVSVLLQRALLYESTEKYKLGAEDLRAVLKIDPSNRLARSTIHRLTQLAG